jgi:hypothetical protein
VASREAEPENGKLWGERRMEDLVATLLGSTWFIVVASSVLLFLLVLIAGAFYQGREITLWPPKIGARPPVHAETEVDAQSNHVQVSSAEQSDGRQPAGLSKSMANDLGRGIGVGGEYKGDDLQAISAGWQRYGSSGWVISGWLFTPAAPESHAVAFFKIHLFDDGSGYGHILDASNPVHTVWLGTRTGFRREERFCWDQDPDVRRTDLWRFRWQ